MTHDERQEVVRETLERAMSIVQKYQNANWRRLKVNIICSEIKCLLADERARQSAGSD